MRHWFAFLPLSLMKWNLLNGIKKTNGMVDGWVGLLFLIFVGLWAAVRPMLRKKEKTNKQTNHSATKQKKSSAVCLRRQQLNQTEWKNWMKFGLVRRRKKKTNKRLPKHSTECAVSERNGIQSIAPLGHPGNWWMELLLFLLSSINFILLSSSPLMEMKAINSQTKERIGLLSLICFISLLFICCGL